VHEQSIHALDDEEGEKTVAEQAVTWKAEANTVLDVRPDLENGGEPFVRIMEAASVIQLGETLVIIAPFEPVPLYDVLAARGFSHETAMVAADEWVVRFARA
jgi:uncharacterized protein (DUF2249 family)